MHYLERGAEKRRDTRLPVPGTTHAIVVALDYGGKEPSGPVARYARGDDYHDVMDARLRELHRRVASDAGREVRGKPLRGHGAAARARPRAARGARLVREEHEPDQPASAARSSSSARWCSTWSSRRTRRSRRTGAGRARGASTPVRRRRSSAPRELDARRCISYLTIELRGEIPEELREGIGDRIYGCDVCQDVCPWNVRFARELPRAGVRAARGARGQGRAQLARDLLAMTQEEFSRAFKGSPMKRAKLRGLKRNAAVVLGNVGTADDVAVLTRALDDAEPLVREHAAWALARVGPAPRRTGPLGGAERAG